METSGLLFKFDKFLYLMGVGTVKFSRKDRWAGRILGDLITYIRRKRGFPNPDFTFRIIHNPSWKDVCSDFAHALLGWVPMKRHNMVGTE